MATMQAPTFQRQNDIMTDNSSKYEKKKQTVERQLILIRLSLFTSLLALASGIGIFSYKTLRDYEEGSLRLEIQGFGNQISRNVGQGLSKKFTAHETMNDYVQSWVQNGSIGTLPNVTIPGFDGVMTKVANLADLSHIFFAPLVTNKTRSNFEKYTKNNMGLLQNGPSMIKTRPNGCLSSKCAWIIADGISYPVNGVKQRVPDFLPDTEFPTIHFPVWPVAPISSFYKSIMIDIHAFSGSRKITVDQVLKTKKGVFTDFVQPVPASKPQPSAIYMAPITSNEPGNPIIGLFGGAFSFEDILRGVMYQAKGKIDCVIKSVSGAKFTIVLEEGTVTVVGDSDLHDTKYDKYNQSATLLSPSNQFQVDIYPTKSFIDTRLSNRPIIVCSAFVVSVAFAGLLFVIYISVEKRFQNQLMEESHQNLASAVAKDAVLKEKKIYIRYISHEVRLATVNFKNI